LWLCSYIERAENVLLVGDTGTGKTMLATALGLAACPQGRAVRFTTVAALANELLEARTGATTHGARTASAVTVSGSRTALGRGRRTPSSLPTPWFIGPFVPATSTTQGLSQPVVGTVAACPWRATRLIFCFVQGRRRADPP
jgi:energy-coupling factor transporter ATP-binding protein EcfA2